MTTFTKQLSALSPETALSKGTLIGFIQEPSVNDQINDGFLKMITGNDTFFSRKLYDNGGVILPIFKVFLMCNRIPYIPAADDAAKERLVIIPCKSKWVHNAPESIEEQYRQRLFKVDPNFYNHRLPCLGSAMLWIMVNYFPHYIKERLHSRPKEIEDTIREFWEENDVFWKFYKQCIVNTDNNVRLPVDLAFNEFKSWYVSNFPGFKAKITVNVFKDEVSKYIGKPQRGGWIGVKLAGYMTI
jgi:phage/plasmid-associated DNA primase